MQRSTVHIRFGLSIFITVLVTLQSAGQVTIQSPQDVVRDATKELLRVVDEGKTYYDKDPERFYRAVEGVLSPFVDFNAISRGVMAVYGRKATPEQRKRFAYIFKWGLVRTYAGALIDSGQEGIVVLDPLKPPRDPKRQSVKMEITTVDGKVYPLSYSMKQDKDGAWKLRNIIISGVNIGLTYRNQFASAMRDSANDGDLDKVIDGWAEVIAHVNPVGEVKK